MSTTVKVRKDGTREWLRNGKENKMTKTSKNRLAVFGLFEFTWIIATIILGIMEAWGPFAVFALMSVLTPLWITTAAVTSIVDIMVDIMEGKQGKRR